MSEQIKYLYSVVGDRWHFWRDADLLGFLKWSNEESLYIFNFEHSVDHQAVLAASDRIAIQKTLELLHQH